MGSYNYGGGGYTAPHARYISAWRPHDLFLEFVEAATDGSGDLTLTMGTDTNLIGNAIWAYPVDRSADPHGVCVSSLGSTVRIYGQASTTYNIAIIGGVSVAGNAFSLRAPGNPVHPNSSYWEIIKATMSSGTLKITNSSALDYVDRSLWVMPTEVITAAPDANGSGVNDLTTIDFTLECGAASAVVAALVGGYLEASTPADSTIDQKELENLPIYLGDGFHHAPGDLIGEVIVKTLNGASPSTVTITAASDCQIIQSIEMVIPVSKSGAAQLAVAWSGTQGATSAIYSANAEAGTVNCLVLGR